jgi:hypothetical protein
VNGQYFLTLRYSNVVIGGRIAKVSKQQATALVVLKSMSGVDYAVVAYVQTSSIGISRIYIPGLPNRVMEWCLSMSWDTAFRGKICKELLTGALKQIMTSSCFPVRLNPVPCHWLCS